MALKFSVFEAKTRLSELLRLVKSGKKVVINQRGTPVAELVPFQHKEPGSLEDRIKDLRSGGLLSAKKPFDVSFLKSQKKVGALKRFLEDRD